MIKSLSELKKILHFAKKQGIQELQIGQIRAVFTPPSSKPRVVDLGFQPNTSVPVTSYLPGERPLSDDEMLYASTDYLDVLRAEREAATQPETERN